MLEAKFNKKLWHFNMDFNLSLNSEILVLWGPSGAGKTTILHCLAGLVSPNEGIIKLNDKLLYSSAHEINIAARSRNIGYLFQNYALFPHMTVKQNVYYGLKSQKTSLNKAKIDPIKLLESFGINHLKERYPGQLSGGERQRVALARALVVQPGLLLLDEPFSALDKKNKISLRAEIKKLNEEWKIPFIIVTHDEDDASFLGDRVLEINKGQLQKITSKNNV